MMNAQQSIRKPGNQEGRAAVEKISWVPGFLIKTQLS
jgi:hypothetical protein